MKVFRFKLAVQVFLWVRVNLGGFVSGVVASVAGNVVHYQSFGM